MPTIKEQCESRIRELVPELSPCGCSNGHLFLGYDTENGDEPIWGACPDCVIDGRYEPQYKEIELRHILLAINKVIGKREYDMFSIAWNGLMSLSTKDNLSMLEYELDKSFYNQKEQVYKYILEIIK